MLWFRRSVPADLISRLGISDIRRSLRTSDIRIARRRASTLVQVVEEAFETLRSAGLGPDARSALAAILDHVMDDFDGDRRRWADRAKYQLLMERLAGDETSRPIVISSAPTLIMDEDPAELVLVSVCASSQVRTEGVGASSELTLERTTTTPPSVTFGIGALEAMVESAVAAAVSKSLVRPGSRDLLSSRVPTFLAKKEEDLGQNAKHLADYPGRIDIFIGIIGDKPIGDYQKEDMLRYRDILDRVPVNAKKRFRTDDLLEAIRRNELITPPVPLIDAKTVNSKYLSPIKTLFRHLLDQSIIERNPVDGVASKREKIEVVVIGGSEECLPLTNEHIETIKNIAERKQKDSHDRWWISVLPWTGLRLDEFAQLTVFDIQTIHGRPCIDLLHADVSDPDHLERRKILDLKTEASRRVIPIHPDLLAGGFLDFVDRRRRRDGDLDRRAQGPRLLRLSVPARLKQRGNELRFVIDGAADEAHADASLVRLVTRAEIVRSRLIDDRASIDDVAREENLTASYLTRLVRISFLAPDIVAGMLAGRYRDLTARKLMADTRFPLDWTKQREALGAL